MPFASLGFVPELVRAVADEGYAHPTPIQQEAIPLALEGRDPAADTLPPLIVLDAVGKVISMDGERSVPVAQLLKGPYETSLKPSEILAGVSFKKLPHGIKSGSIRLARREAMAIARMSIALLLQVQEGKIRDIRISPGAILPTPQRLSEVEEFLKGGFPDEILLSAASRKVSEAMIRFSGRRPSASYKTPVLESLFLRAMKTALEG